MTDAAPSWTGRPPDPPMSVEDLAAEMAELAARAEDGDPAALTQG